MSQGLRTRTVIGSAYGVRSTSTPRTLNQAFGPYARLETERRFSERLDRLIGIACAAVVVTVLAGWLAVSVMNLLTIGGSV